MKLLQSQETWLDSSLNWRSIECKGVSVSLYDPNSCTHWQVCHQWSLDPWSLFAPCSHVPWQCLYFSAARLCTVLGSLQSGWPLCYEDRRGDQWIVCMHWSNQASFYTLHFLISQRAHPSHSLSHSLPGPTVSVWPMAIYCSHYSHHCSNRWYHSHKH